jgi:hypothetical protein
MDLGVEGPPDARWQVDKSAIGVALVKDHRDALAQLVDQVAGRSESYRAFVEEDQEAVCALDEGRVVVNPDLPPRAVAVRRDEALAQVFRLHTNECTTTP